MKWTSIHIFHNSHNIQVVKEAIRPIVHELTTNKKIDIYFYIFYNEHGNHIRLRVRSLSESEHIMDFVREFFSNFFLLFPSKVEFDRPVSYYPIDSVQLISYSPEFERYGGIVGTAISEKSFYYSSKTVLEYIAGMRQTNDYYSTLLNFAFKLHLGTLHTYFHGNIEDSILFLRSVFGGFVYSKSKVLTPFDFTKEGKYCNSFFEQKNVLCPFVKEIWSNLTNGVPVDSTLENWINYEKEISSEMRTAFHQGNIETVFAGNIEPTWIILQSYIHMTNNRLGIHRIDEPLIAYLLMRCLMEY